MVATTTLTKISTVQAEPYPTWPSLGTEVGAGAQAGFAIGHSFADRLASTGARTSDAGSGSVFVLDEKSSSTLATATTDSNDVRSRSLVGGACSSESVDHRPDEEAAWSSVLRTELTIAARILKGLSRMPTFPSIWYARSALRVCTGNIFDSSLASATRLIYMRNALLSRISYAEWLRLQAAINPGKTVFRVPPRFVRADEFDATPLDVGYFDAVVAESLVSLEPLEPLAR